MNVKSWISPKTKKAQPSSIHGLGYFAADDIKQGEFIAIKGGHIIDKATLEANATLINHSEMQIADDLWLAPLTEEEVNDSMIFINHSCEPNMVVQGQIAHIAYKDIAKGEEITADYGISFNNPDFSLECHCGSPVCRKLITGLDWKKPEIQNKYGDNFPWYILRKIKGDT